MTKFKTIVTSALGALCALTACAAIALSDGGEKFSVDAAGTHSTEISMTDFDSTSFVYTTLDQSSGSSLTYKFAEGKSLPMEGKAGVAVRVKNLSGADYSIFQVYIYVEDSTLVYSPYNLTATFQWMSGGVTTTKHSSAARYIIIPKDFDGYMFLDFTQMTVIRPSTSSSFDFKNTALLSAEGEGDFALPTGNYNQFGFFTLKSYAGKELIFGEHTTYTVSETGSYVLDSERATADLSTKALLSGSYPIADVQSLPSLTCNFTGDDHVTFAEASASVPYGYTLAVPARFAAGYTQGTVTVGEGESAITQTSLAVKNTYKTDTVLAVSVQSRLIALDSTARVLDPDDNGTTSANYGGAFAFATPVTGVGADGVFVRVRNTTDKTYTLNTIFLNGENGVQYSLLNTLVTFVGTDGTVTTNRAASGATVKNRNANIPALFDGYMVIPFSELVSTHVDNNVSASADWNKYEGDKLLINSTDPWRSYPKCNLTGINVYFTKGGGNEGANELILGDFGTYIGEAATFTATQTTAFDPSVSSLTANGGLVTVAAFPEAELTVSLKINGASVLSDETLDLGAESGEITLTYGEALALSPVSKLGYALVRVDCTGAEERVLTDAVYVNLLKTGGAVALDFVTEETAQATVSEDPVSLSDKAGIKVSVNNAGSDLDWRLVLTDGETKYVASSAGAGLIRKDGAVVYGDVFSVPAGFVGELYIPFNVWRGSLYGGKQLLPFDYAEGGKPESVTGKIYIDCLTGQDKTEIAQIFSAWEYVAELPAVTAAATTNANLYAEGDADLVGGAAVSPRDNLSATAAGSAKAFRITPSQLPSFDCAGFALRVKNISGADFGLRVYAVGSDGKTYVPQQKNVYTLIRADGREETLTDTNRNVILPAGFDGTVLVHFADYATDTVTAGAGQNVVREGLSLRYLNLYSAGSAQGLLVGGAATIGYDGAATPLGAVSYGEDKTDTIDVRAIAAASVTADNASVTLSADSVIYGTTQITLTAAEGKLITGVTVPEECSAQKNADGSYTVTVVRPVTSVAESYALTVTTDNALSVTVTVSGSGRVSYLGAEISGGIVVPESESYYLSAVPSAGFETTVTAGGIAVEASEQGYLIPAGTSAVEVAFTRLQAKLTVSLGENGTATLVGEALYAGEYTLDQGETYLLTVLPARGYEATVTLGGETLTPGDEGYEIVLDGDSALSVTFEPAVYTITYDLDRGTNGNNPQTYTVNDAVTFEAATKDGYTFLYWYVLDGDTEREITGIEQGSVGDLTVHAKFEMNAVEPAKGGCGSVAFGGGCAAVALCAAALVALGKKRK